MYQTIIDKKFTQCIPTPVLQYSVHVQWTDGEDGCNYNLVTGNKLVPHGNECVDVKEGASDACAFAWGFRCEVRGRRGCWWCAVRAQRV